VSCKGDAAAVGYAAAPPELKGMCFKCLEKLECRSMNFADMFNASYGAMSG